MSLPGSELPPPGRAGSNGHPRSPTLRLGEGVLSWDCTHSGVLDFELSDGIGLGTCGLGIHPDTCPIMFTFTPTDVDVYIQCRVHCFFPSHVGSCFPASGPPHRASKQSCIWSWSFVGTQLEPDVSWVAVLGVFSVPCLNSDISRRIALPFWGPWCFCGSLVSHCPEIEAG
jgi:hypothetical protein